MYRKIHNIKLLCLLLCKSTILNTIRIVPILFFIGISSISATPSYSQEVKVSIHIKNGTVNDLFETIKSQTSYSFWFDVNDVNMARPLTIDAENKSVSQILHDVLKEQNLEFKLNGTHIIIMKKDGLATTPQQNNERKIAGIVTDKKGEGIIGANISVKGTTNGTITDIEGRFSLNVPQQAVLQISFIGYISQEIPVKNNQAITIMLLEDAQALDEVVVVGYGTQKKVNLTGSVAAVGGEVLENRPISNLGQGLQGMVPNLNVTPGNGLPGQGSTYNIRGNASINGGEPLVLVDGVQMDPNLINPQDIASVSVLKDAASAAVYGARGAYGVILISTKQGATDKAPVISFNTNWGLHQPTKIADSPTGLEFANYFNHVQKNSGLGPKYSEQYMQHIIAYDKDPVNNQPVFFDPVNFDKFDYMYCGNTNWYEAVLNKVALNQQYNVNINGGDKRTSYYASLGMISDKGLLKGYPDTYQRYNANLNINSQVAKWLQVSAKVMYNHSVQNIPGGNEYPWGGGTDWGANMGLGSMFPLMPVYHPDGNYAGQGTWTNPVGNAALGGYKKTKNNDFWLTGGVKITPLEGLSLVADYTFNYYNTDQIRHRKAYVEYKAVPGAEKVFPWTSPSSVRNMSNNDYYHVINLYAEYEKTIQKNYFKVMAGYNQENKYLRGYGGERLQLINNDIPYPDLAKGDMFMRNSTAALWAVQGCFFRVNYSFDERYLLELNGRVDASSKFPTDSRSGFFPSASAAWRISNEAFMEPVREVINELKVRASYGSLGNQTLDPATYGYFPYYPAMRVNPAFNYLLGGSLPVSISAPKLVSNSFTWETVRQVDLGVDFGLLNNRLTGSFDWYERKTLDMLAPQLPFPATLGEVAPNENSADMKTNGWELSLKWRNNTQYGLNYYVGLVLADYQSTILKYTNPQGIIDKHYEGKKIDEVWGYTTEGLFRNEEEIGKHANQSALYGGQWYPGDVKFKDLNGDGKIDNGKNTLSDHGDLSVIGNTTPRYTFGLTLGADWKGFDLDLFFQGVAKKDYFPTGSIFWGMSSEWDVPTAFVIGNYWTEDQPNGFLPRQSFWNGNRQKQTGYKYSGAYMRLKQLTLGYTLPRYLTEKAGISKVRIYFTGQNLFTIDGLPQQYDPETLEPSAYPPQQIYSFGLNVSF